MKFVLLYSVFLDLMISWFFFRGVVITRDNVCFSLTKWLICVYISFADKETMKFKGYQLNFSERLLTHYQIWLSNYIYLLEMFVRQIVNFFSPDENATPARVRCSRDRQARKKWKSSKKNAKLITFLCSMGIIPLHQCSFLAAAAAVSSYLGGSGARIGLYAAVWRIKSM